MNIKQVLLEHSATARLYSERAEWQGVFLGNSPEYWRGAADTYQLIAEVMFDDDEEVEL